MKHLATFHKVIWFWSNCAREM